MSDQNQTQKKYKWNKVGSILKAKPPYNVNKDGSERLYLKVDKAVILKEGENLSLFVPTSEKTPDYVVFDVMKRNA